MLALGTETSELKKTISSIVRPLKEVKAGTVETEWDLKKAQDTIAVLGFREKS